MTGRGFLSRDERRGPLSSRVGDNGFFLPQPSSWGSVKRLSTALLVAGGVACVPATNDLHPKGGFSVHLVASPATAGQPFTTADGWTITFEKTAIRPMVSASAGDFHAAHPTITSTTQDQRAMMTTSNCELRLTLLDPGDAVIRLDLQPAFRQPGSDFALDRPCGFDPELLARFEAQSDEAPYAGAPDEHFTSVASVGFVAHAEKNGRTVHISLFVNTFGADVPFHQQLILSTVQANKGVPIQFEVYFESLFVADKSGVQLPVPEAFEVIANADADGDGNITPAELNAVETCVGDETPVAPVSSSGDDDDATSASATDATCPTLLGRLVARASFVVAIPDGPEIADPSSGADYNQSGDDDDFSSLKP
jgi:hypothetical protein